MNRTKLGYLLVGAATVALIALAMLIMSSHKAFGSVDKITWCHVEPNGNQETLHLPLQALEQAGHVDANGNPLHAGDHAGECVTPTPTVTPTLTPDFTPSPTAGGSATLTPTQTPSTTPTQAPSPTVEHHAVPTDTPLEDRNQCTVKDCSTQPVVQDGKALDLGPSIYK